VLKYFLFLSSLGLIGLSGCSSADSGWKEQRGLKVLAGFPPLACLAENIVGDAGEVLSITTTAGVHSEGDPNSREIRLAREADVIFINGLGLQERYVRKLRAPAANPKWKVVELGKLIDEKWLLEGECHHEHAAGEEHEHPTDPHLWLSPTRAEIYAREICNVLKELNPEKASVFEANCTNYVQKLTELKAFGLNLLNDKKERKFVSFHDSLQYFAKDFQLQIAGVIELEPGVEPGAKQMSELLDLCIKENLRVIAVEPQFTAKNAATTIREELKKKGIEAEFVEIDTLETAEKVTPELYIHVMRQNLENLAKALK